MPRFEGCLMLIVTKCPNAMSADGLSKAPKETFKI